tara:strand:+ start:76 stop:315 length:240 start_codon:yes stop_codon:yes gene_type:complete
MVETRRQRKIREELENKVVKYDNKIDFDEASYYWNANKIKYEGCSYEYVCGFELKKGFCKKRLEDDNILCKKHKFWINK